MVNKIKAKDEARIKDVNQKIAETRMISIEKENKHYELELKVYGGFITEQQALVEYDEFLKQFPKWERTKK